MHVFQNVLHCMGVNFIERSIEVDFIELDILSHIMDAFEFFEQVLTPVFKITRSNVSFMSRMRIVKNSKRTLKILLNILI
jgi:hypothetical protein